MTRAQGSLPGLPAPAFASDLVDSRNSIVGKVITALLLEIEGCGEHCRHGDNHQQGADELELKVFHRRILELHYPTVPPARKQPRLARLLLLDNTPLVWFLQANHSQFRKIEIRGCVGKAQRGVLELQHHAPNKKRIDFLPLLGLYSRSIEVSKAYGEV